MQTWFKKQNRYARFWLRPAIQQRWFRLRGWIARALEKLADGG